MKVQQKDIYVKGNRGRGNSIRCMIDNCDAFGAVDREQRKGEKRVEREVRERENEKVVAGM